jgi:hypothetical protein
MEDPGPPDREESANSMNVLAGFQLRGVLPFTVFGEAAYRPPNDVGDLLSVGVGILF